MWFIWILMFTVWNVISRIWLVFNGHLGVFWFLLVVLVMRGERERRALKLRLVEKSKAESELGEEVFGAGSLWGDLWRNAALQKCRVLWIGGHEGIRDKCEIQLQRSHMSRNKEIFVILWCLQHAERSWLLIFSWAHLSLSCKVVLLTELSQLHPCHGFVISPQPVVWCLCVSMASSFLLQPWFVSEVLFSVTGRQC